MGFVTWLAIVVLMYYVIGRSIFIVIDAFQRRRPVQLALWIAGVAVAVGVTAFWTGVVDVAGFSFSQTVLFLLSALFIAALWMFGQEVVARRNLKWQDTKRRRELSRQIKLHLALISGALVFSVPFYWLITTSLKPDERTNVYAKQLCHL